MILYFCKRGSHFEAQKIIDLRGIYYATEEL